MTHLLCILASISVLSVPLAGRMIFFNIFTSFSVTNGNKKKKCKKRGKGVNHHSGDTHIQIGRVMTNVYTISFTEYSDLQFLSHQAALFKHLMASG